MNKKWESLNHFFHLSISVPPSIHFLQHIRGQQSQPNHILCPGVSPGASSSLKMPEHQEAFQADSTSYVSSLWGRSVALLWSSPGWPCFLSYVLKKTSETWIEFGANSFQSLVSVMLLFWSQPIVCDHMWGWRRGSNFKSRVSPLSLCRCSTWWTTAECASLLMLGQFACWSPSLVGSLKMDHACKR